MQVDPLVRMDGPSWIIVDHWMTVEEMDVSPEALYSFHTT